MNVCQIRKSSPIVVATQINISIYNATAIPSELVIAEAEQNIAANRAACNCNAIRATADADISPYSSVGKNNRVITETSDQIAINRPSGHIEVIVVQLHVDTTNPSAGHNRMVAIVEGIDYPTARHKKRIKPITLIERTNLAAGHLKVINTGALLYISSNGAAGNHEHIGPAPLIDTTRYRTGMNFDTVIANTKCDVTIDDAGPVNG
nr:hypothetical protein [Ochrobactrum sp. CM-21-5]